MGYAPPVLGTAVEAIFSVPVPFLDAVWKLTLVSRRSWPTPWSATTSSRCEPSSGWGRLLAATGLVVLVYAGAIACWTWSSGWEGDHRVWPAVLMAIAVVLLNPLYLRSQRLVDRLFFRQRLDMQQSLERVSEDMISLLDLRRIAELIARTVDDLFHPSGRAPLLDSPPGGSSRRRRRRGTSGTVGRAVEGRLGPGPLFRVRRPLTRDRLEEDPASGTPAGVPGRDGRPRGTLAVPVLFRDRLTGILALGPKQADAAYSAEDLRSSGSWRTRARWPWSTPRPTPLWPTPTPS